MSILSTRNPACLAAWLAAAVFLTHSSSAQTRDLLRQGFGLVEIATESDQPSSSGSSIDGPVGAGQASAQATPTPAAAGDTPPDAPAPQTQTQNQNQNQQKAKDDDPPAPGPGDAAQQLKAEEKQRVLGIVPNFNVTYLGQDTAPLSPGQKFHLALRSTIDPFVFVAAAADAGINQAENDFPEYGQGFKGYAKRFGASYADTANGTIIGNAILPSLLHQDPRYYRRGIGSFRTRLLYSMATTIWCKNDNGTYGPNYSNVFGNLAAGGISNLYYPASDRGVGLTFERGFTVTAEGTIGAVFDEFWPDIFGKVFRQHLTGFQPPAQVKNTQTGIFPH